MTLPNGADAILAVRKRGMKPSDMVIVSLIGPLDERNTTVLANPDAAYDWRWTIGLKLCVFVNTATAQKAKATLMAIGKSCPDSLLLWNVDQYAGAYVSALPILDCIDKPKSLWQYRLNVLAWLDCENKDFERSVH